MRKAGWGPTTDWTVLPFIFFASSHPLAEPFHAPALHFLLPLASVNRMTLAADLHLLVLHRAGNFEHGIAGRADNLCLRVHRWMDT